MRRSLKTSQDIIDQICCFLDDNTDQIDHGQMHIFIQITDKNTGETKSSSYKPLLYDEV